VVVEQPDEPELGNHVGIRHASALHAAAYGAGRALVLESAGDREVELASAEIAYVNVAMGPLRFVAEPREVPDGDFGTSVVGTDENGKTVVTVDAVWNVGGSS
jgi:hypothetical protein